MEATMIIFDVFANGAFWGTFEAVNAEAAMQLAAAEFGTTDVDADAPSTEGMTAEEVPSRIKLTKGWGWSGQTV
jgi:hypothetical protein